MSLSQSRWLALWDRLGLHGSPHGCFRRLRRAHGQWWRAYHDAEHVAECLTWLDEVKRARASNIQDPDGVEVAFWFHDAIYVPWLPKNEERSAGWAVKVLSKAGLDESRVARVHEWIMDTLHRSEPSSGDGRWMVDIDLAILGADAERFGRYESQIRREYRWVRSSRYRQGRAAVLQSFLDRPRIYTTELFQARLEQRARQNLRKALADLNTP